MLRRYICRSAPLYFHRTARPQLARRPMLPMSDGPNFPKYLQHPPTHFPYKLEASMLGITPRANPTECAELIKHSLEALLLQHGAVLLRGFPLAGATDFSELFTALGLYRQLVYINGQKVMNVQSGGSYTTCQEQPEVCIDLHNEMGYLNHWPDRLLFYCARGVEEGSGGETCIADGRNILNALDPDVLQKLESLGVMYRQHADDYKTPSPFKPWQEIFVSNVREQVEQQLKQEAQQFKWHTDGSLTWHWSVPAVRTHPVTEEKVWFNHLQRKHASRWKYHPHWDHLLEMGGLDRDLPTHTFYGNGEEIDSDVIQHIRNVTWEQAVGFQMKKGDVIILDNMLCQHGRLSYKGARKILAIMGEKKLSQDSSNEDLSQQPMRTTSFMNY